MRSPDRLRWRCCLLIVPSSSRPPADAAVFTPAALRVELSLLHLSGFGLLAAPICSLLRLFEQTAVLDTVQIYYSADTTLQISPTAMNNRRNSMKKDDRHSKEKLDRKIIRHPTAPFSTKSIIMNLIIAFFLYLLRRVIEAGGKSAITKYSRFIK